MIIFATMFLFITNTVCFGVFDILHVLFALYFCAMLISWNINNMYFIEILISVAASDSICSLSNFIQFYFFLNDVWMRPFARHNKLISFNFYIVQYIPQNAW